MRHIIYYTHSLLKRADINFVRIIDTHKNMINEMLLWSLIGE